MFTGLIETTGTVTSHSATDQGGRLEVRSDLGAELQVGDSIAVNGVCLTAIRCDPRGFAADISPATIAATTLGSFRPGRVVNLERPLRADARLGGHFVLGHVDATARIVAFNPDGEAHRLEIELPPAMAPLVISKGSIAIDGISLTIAALLGHHIVLQIIPFTFAHTALAHAASGDLVNVEADVLGKYVHRMFEARGGVTAASLVPTSS
jgi:riboflavin synthase